MGRAESPGLPANILLWLEFTVRDLDTAAGYLRNCEQNRRDSVVGASALIGALLSYARPFTERSNPSLNPLPEQQHRFLELAAQLGADLRVHAALMQVRADVVALSERVPVVSANPTEPSGASLRRFNYPDPNIDRVMESIDLRAFAEVVQAMRRGCEAWLAERTGIGS
jgi:hypothetical protein